MSKVDAIIFRMYHTGSVGDCFLLRFMQQKKVTYSMLIDCGGWLTSAPVISECVKDIRTACGGELDLLVVTHQHMDHISGFNQARAEFDQLKVKEVWLSWIEDETDDVARILKEQFGKKLKAAEKMAAKAQTILNELSEKKINVRGAKRNIDAKNMSIVNALDLISFERGFFSADDRAAGKPSNDVAMKYIKEKGEKLNFFLPGEVINGKGGAAGVKFYILGPPRDEDMRFFKINEDDDEMYHLMKSLAAKTAEVEPEENIIDTGVLLEDGVSPFGAQYKTGEPIRFSTEQEEADYAWRGIESDWLETAASIALRATRLTNNTSLALAIEFEDSGRVMLLPGDAQSGNWMGWHKRDVMEALKKNGGKDTEELLKNTVFYKVGHHCSHNGTASVSGLDRMGHKDMVVFVPLVQDKVPKQWGGSDNFPAKKLYEVLIKKTRGRVVRTDVGLIPDGKAKEERKKLNGTEEAAFGSALKTGNNYIEFTIKG